VVVVVVPWNGVGGVRVGGGGNFRGRWTKAGIFVMILIAVVVSSLSLRLVHRTLRPVRCR
jgi:hypothetical protein